MRFLNNNIYLHLSLVCISFCCMSTQCRKEVQNETYYQFQDKVDLSPAKKSYQIGDTIWVAYNKQDKNFLDQISKSEIHIDTASITILVSMQSPDFNYSNTPPGGICGIVSISDGQMQPVTDSIPVIIAYFGCNLDNNFNFKIGYILKQKGVFEISLEGVCKLPLFPGHS
jgi:hypothetical protein